MAAATLYPGKINSPATFLTAPYTVGDGLLNVDDTGVFPAAPNIVVVAASATDITAVTYIYTAIGVNQLTGVTLLEGTDKDWPINTPCARDFTNHDWQGVVDRFHATTGHKHTAATGDGPQLDHGQLGGLTDDDHVRYFDKDGSKTITGTTIQRDVDTSSLAIKGGNGASSSFLQFFGGHYPVPGYEGEIVFAVTNAAQNGTSIVFYVTGKTDTPSLNMYTRKIVNMGNPTDAQDAATKNYVDTRRTIGATSVADGGTITHSLGATPTAVICTPTTSAEMVSVTAKGATTFTVAIKKHDGTAGTTAVVYWTAWL